VGAPSSDWNAVLIRSDKGKALFSSAVDEKKIIVKEGDEITNYAIPLIEKEARRKKEKMEKTMQEVTPLLQMIGASEEEAKVYSILLFLSRSDFVTLSKWTRLQEESLKNILTSLKEKGWLKEIYGRFVPTNLSHAYQAKDPSFQEKLKELEKQRSELEELYMRKVVGYLE
jgi:predicted DNA-binding transcriptional regulator